MTRTRQQTVSILMWALIVSLGIARGQTPVSRSTTDVEQSRKQKGCLRKANLAFMNNSIETRGEQ
jgi:hypothetical protein